MLIAASRAERKHAREGWRTKFVVVRADHKDHVLVLLAEVVHPSLEPLIRWHAEEWLPVALPRVVAAPHVDANDKFGRALPSECPFKPLSDSSLDAVLECEDSPNVELLGLEILV